MQRILLIGNGPAALSRKAGKEIDNFDGLIARFNNYTTKGFEEYVGSRTDYWITNSEYPPTVNEHKKVLFFSWREDEPTTSCQKRINAFRIPIPYGIKTTKTMKFHVPSLGAIATTWLLDHEYEVWLWGFDFLENTRGRKHHYNNDGQDRGTHHKSDAEWYFFHRHNDLRLVKWFGVPDGESLPRVRENIECGRNGNIADSRDAAHRGWYSWFAESCVGKSVLDVGCGLCVGMQQLREGGASEVCGFDVDDNLKDLSENVIIGKSVHDLSQFEDNSFDIITAVEVIEHVTEDLIFMEHLRRIAREKIMLTTPCYLRSKCFNGAHCREYTIPQFMNIFKPDEIWSAAPSGTAHRTFLLERNGDVIIDHSPEGLMNKRQLETLPYYRDKLPFNLPFDQTVDGEEWPCICAIFNVKGD